MARATLVARMRDRRRLSVAPDIVIIFGGNGRRVEPRNLASTEAPAQQRLQQLLQQLSVSRSVERVSVLGELGDNISSFGGSTSGLTS